MKTIKMVLVALIVLIATGCSVKEHQYKAKTDKPKVPKEAILQLDTKGHTALINDILVTKSGDIISASTDKTIRVWDSKTGREKRKILGEIGAGNEGMIFAIALSGDERYLAVGGYLAGKEISDKTAIRIYNYQTGKLLKILKSHTDVVLDLAFSEDGKFLISGSADTTAKIWSVRENFKLQDTIRFHTNHVYATKIIKKQSSYFAITAGWDNKIALYDMQKKKIIKSVKSDYKLQYLAINKRLGHIAACGFGREIRIYDFNLHSLLKIASKTKPSGLAYSLDGRYLLAGAGAYPDNINIYKSTKGYTLKSSFTKHTNLTMAVNFLDNKRAISGGGDNNEIYIWDIDSTKVKKRIVGAGEVVWSVGIDGDEIAWGNVFDPKSQNNLGKLQKSINLKTFKIDTIRPSQLKSFKRVSTTSGTYSLSHSKGGDYGYSDGVLHIKKGGTTIAQIVKGSTTGYGHRCYGWYKEYIISGGANGSLKIYNKKGVEVASLIGHTGEVLSIALDGDRLVSGGSDQRVMVWDLSFLESLPPLEFNEKVISLVEKKLKWTREEIINKEQVLLKYGINIYKTIVIHPTLTIFVSKDNEYVAYTKEGFFNASKSGAKYIGYHINQGAEKEAQFVTVDKLYNTFYRPDLVQKALSGESLSSYAKRISIDEILGSGFAPVVKIKSYHQTKRDVMLHLEVCTVDGGGYDNLTLTLNGMAVDVIEKNRGLKLKRDRKREECFSFNKLISLQNGKNVIGFQATNGAGTIESNIDKITLNYRGRSSAKPDLYILAVGVDRYRDGDLWLKYSKADADAFIKSMKKVADPLFKNIYTYRLFDRDATKSKIIDMFEKIGAKTTREDVFIFYMAGHGITDTKTGAYFYLPVDFRYRDENSVREAGVSQRDFKIALAKIQAMKSLVILDTCNSGSFSEAMASRGVLQKTAINKLTRATGRATIVASSKDQVALEGYRGHGVFTYTLLEALRGRGYGSDNKITIKELASYIEDVLPDRTYEKWGYEQVPQSNISGNDFPIGVR